MSTAITLKNNFSNTFDKKNIDKTEIIEIEGIEFNKLAIQEMFAKAEEEIQLDKMGLIKLKSHEEFMNSVRERILHGSHFEQQTKLFNFTVIPQ
ncbi:MAG: hypothetical protein FWG64_00990 [Firmicutes bacterium]|nr:hypothetical protein [Bacillota bacterium]